MTLKHAQKAYVRALFDLCEKKDCVKVVQEDMRGIKKAINNSHELAKFLKDYSISRKKREKCISLILGGKVHPITWRFLMLVENKRRMGWLHILAEIFEELCCQKEGIKKIYITSAFPLEKEQESLIAQKTARKAGELAEWESAVKPELIGGFTVMMDDLLYDWSIAGFLRKLKRSFSEMRINHATGN